MAKRRKGKKKQQKKYSTIKDHKHQGKKLIPTWRQIPNFQTVSWMNDRLPDMLWAILLVKLLPREQALNVFRLIVKYIDGLPEDKKFGDVTHTGLSKLPSKHLDDVLSIISAHQQQKQALAPLLLLEELPAKEAWTKVLDVDATNTDWEPLMIAVAHTLGHQSQAATDCRWLRVFCAMVAYELPAPRDKETLDGINFYPNVGDLRAIRPAIRAFENGLTTEEKLSGTDTERLTWADKFWDECLVKTPCFQSNSKFTETDISTVTTKERVDEVYNLLVEHTYNTQTTSGVDARHDATLGIGLYCLKLLGELLRVESCNSISARTTLRTIAECYITLAYLAKKDKVELWQSYRVYGAGQAKLAFLKLDESADEPSYVDVQTLEQLANEDMWQEFLDIDLGHWDNTNLRKMSMEAGVKDVYDQFYDWTSTFAHGHWAAIRDTVFETCRNPLHRLHRIPRQFARTLPNVVPDAGQLVDKILEVVSQLYPDFPDRVTVDSD